MMPVTEVLVSSEEIKEKVREIGERITEDYQGERLLLVGILGRGFLSDLMRHLQLRARSTSWRSAHMARTPPRAGWSASQGPPGGHNGPPRPHSRGHHRHGANPLLPEAIPARASQPPWSMRSSPSPLADR